MALTPDYAHKNSTLLSKVVMADGTAVYVKDADLRAIVEGFGNATAKDVASAISDSDAGLTTGIQVYNYVTEAVADLAGAMHFVGTSTTDPTSAGGPTIAGHTGEYAAGDVALYGVVEYIYDGTNWRELGDEGLWVPNTRTLAGMDLSSNRSVSDFQTALGLHALAYANTASATVSDYATGITGASYTPAGEVTATVGTTAAAASLTKADYTPAGSVSGTVVPSGSVTLTADADGSFQVAGTNASSAVTVDSSNATVLGSIKDAAVAPSFSEGAFTPASLSYSAAKTFAVAGVTVAMGAAGTDDAETLTFSNASTDTASLINSFSGGSKAADTFSAGSAATFNNATVIGSISGGTAAAQTFTGAKFAPTFAGDTNNISASFSGTKAENALVTAVSYDKTTVSDLAFSGTAATITPTLNKGSKTIQVSPDAVV